MQGLRHTASILFGLLLCACVVFELAELLLSCEGEQVVLIMDMDSEESEEGQEEEREGPEEKKEQQGEYEAMLHAQRWRAAAEGQLSAQCPPPSRWKALVEAKIWEPPEQG